MARAAAVGSDQSRTREWNANATIVPIRERPEDDEEPAAQLVEMLDERRLLAVPKATRQAAHTVARRSRARSAAERVRQSRREE